MVKLRNSFEGGTNAIDITPGNSGGVSGDAFAAVTPTTPFTNAQAHSGVLSMGLPASAISGYGRWAFAATKNVAARTYHRLSGAISATDFDVMQIRVGATNIATIRISGYSAPAGALRLRVGAVTSWTATAALPLNTWFRVEALIEQGTGAADGRIRLAYFLGDDTTAVQDSGWITGLALGGDGAGIDSVVLGKTSGAASPASFMDDAAANTGADYTGSFIGSSVVPAASSPAKRWNVATSAYVDLDSRRWDGTKYVPVDISGGM